MLFRPPYAIHHTQTHIEDILKRFSHSMGRDRDLFIAIVHIIC